MDEFEKQLSAVLAEVVDDTNINKRRPTYKKAKQCDIITTTGTIGTEYIFSLSLKEPKDSSNVSVHLELTPINNAKAKLVLNGVASILDEFTTSCASTPTKKEESSNKENLKPQDATPPCRSVQVDELLFQSPNSYSDFTPLKSNHYAEVQRLNSSSFRLKCFHQQTGEVRSIKLNKPGVITFSEAVDLIKKEFLFDPQNSVVTIRAPDDDGNFSLIRTQVGFQDAIACAKAKKLKKKPNATKFTLHLFIFDSTTSNDKFSLDTKIQYQESLYQGKYVLGDYIYQHKNYFLRCGQDVTTNRALTFKFTTTYSMYLRELYMLQSVSSEFIVPMYSHYEDRERNYYCIVLDWDGDSSHLLSEILKDEKYRTPSTPCKKAIDGSQIVYKQVALNRKSIVQSITNCLHHFHDKNIVFCDLQPHNIVCIQNSTEYDGDIRCRFINLGNCCEIGEGIDVQRLTEIYHPPELATYMQTQIQQSTPKENTPGSKGSRKKLKPFTATFTLDMWNLGLIIFQLTHHRPLDQLPEVIQFVQHLTVQGHLPFQFTSLPPPQVIDVDMDHVLWSLITKDPEHRATTAEVLKYFGKDETIGIHNEQSTLYHILDTVMKRAEFTANSTLGNRLEEIKRKLSQAKTSDDIEPLRSEINILCMTL